MPLGEILRNKHCVNHSSKPNWKTTGKTNLNVNCADFNFLLVDLTAIHLLDLEGILTDDVTNRTKTYNQIYSLLLAGCVIA